MGILRMTKLAVILCGALPLFVCLAFLPATEGQAAITITTAVETFRKVKQIAEYVEIAKGVVKILTRRNGKVNVLNLDGDMVTCDWKQKSYVNKLSQMEDRVLVP